MVAFNPTGVTPEWAPAEATFKDEPGRTKFTLDELEAEFRTCGFADVEFQSPEAIRSRYLAGRTDLPAPKHTTLASALI